MRCSFNDRLQEEIVSNIDRLEQQIERAKVMIYFSNTWVHFVYRKLALLIALLILYFGL